MCVIFDDEEVKRRMVERVKVDLSKVKPKNGAGRPKGTTGILKVDGNVRSAKQIRDWAFRSGEMPHVFLLKVSRGDRIGNEWPTFEQRVDAAKACAPYFAPKIATLSITGEDGGPVQTQQLVLNAETMGKLSDGELEVFRYLFGKLSGQSPDGDGRAAPNSLSEEKARKQYTRTLDLKPE